MIITLRCLLLLQPAAAVAVALPGAMTRTLSEALTPYREHAFIPWPLLDALSAPSLASGPHLRQSLGLPAMLGLVSIVLPVRTAVRHVLFSLATLTVRTSHRAEHSPRLPCGYMGLSISIAPTAKLECAALQSIRHQHWTEHARTLIVPSFDAAEWRCRSD